MPNHLRRIVFTGIACPPHVWEQFLPIEEGDVQEIVPFIELVNAAGSSVFKISDLFKIAAQKITAFHPTEMIVHDIGVPVGVMGAAIAQRTDPTLRLNIIAFNGALSGFDVEKAPHPQRIQTMSYAEFQWAVQRSKGEVDPQYEKHYPTIQALYRQIIEASKAAPRPLQTFHFGGKTLILASRNDPYIPFECLEILQRQLEGSQLEEINYGHFPYSADPETVKYLQEKIKLYVHTML